MASAGGRESNTLLYILHKMVFHILYIFRILFLIYFTIFDLKKKLCFFPFLTIALLPLE